MGADSERGQRERERERESIRRYVVTYGRRLTGLKGPCTERDIFTSSLGGHGCGVGAWRRRVGMGVDVGVGVWLGVGVGMGIVFPLFKCASRKTSGVLLRTVTFSKQSWQRVWPLMHCTRGFVVGYTQRDAARAYQCIEARREGVCRCTPWQLVCTTAPFLYTTPGQ